MTKLLIRAWFGLNALPFGVYRLLAFCLSAVLALLVFVFGSERRNVTLTNLRLCFPESSAYQRVVWTIGHMFLYVRTFLDRAWLWNGTDTQLRQRVIITNPEQIAQHESDKSRIFLAPHFLGLDAAWSRLGLEVDMVTMYSNQKNLVLNEVIKQGRQRYGDQLLLSRQQGVRPLIQAMKKGRPLYYLPDMDFGEKDSVFVTFFGVQAATVTAVSRLARLLDADVIPVTTVFRAGKYEVTLHSPLSNFPTADDAESTQLLNHCIEKWVKTNLMQYLWLHKRFKTRPAGQARIY